MYVNRPNEEEFRRNGGELPTGYGQHRAHMPSPEVPLTLRQWGFNVAIYPALGMSVATAALAQGYRHLSARGHTIDLPVPMYTMDQLHELVGFHEVWEFEQRHASAGQEG